MECCVLVLIGCHLAFAHPLSLAAKVVNVAMHGEVWGTVTFLRGGGEGLFSA